MFIEVATLMLQLYPADTFSTCNLAARCHSSNVKFLGVGQALETRKQWGERGWMHFLETIQDGST